eukprot:GDKI01031615.1.p1 GENE.GDKI01031615.1~~GDKI01031615.1.p1  ORF type:complete len:137 (-),score=20.92 GDKI01031615.1:160-570(-)
MRSLASIVRPLASIASPYSASSSSSSRVFAPSQTFLGGVRHRVEFSYVQKNKDADTKNLPFKINRTTSGNLPIYAKIRKRGTEVTTIVRMCFGDVQALRKELMNVCEAPVREHAGFLEVKGLHTHKIKDWLVSLGF